MSDKEGPLNLGETRNMRTIFEAEATISCDTWDDDNNQPLYEVYISGLVSWSELEALAHMLHPRDLTAIGHATEVRDAIENWSLDEQAKEVDDE